MRTPRKALAEILIFSFAVILPFFFLFDSTYADPTTACPDTVYFEPVPQPRMSPDGDTFYVDPDGRDIKINVNLKNDITIAALIFPLFDRCYNGSCFLDPDKNNGSTNPKCFEGNRVDHWGITAINLELYPQIYLGATNMMAPYLPPGDGPIATLIFTAYDSGAICLDTLFLPAGQPLSLVDTLAVGYTPVFIPGTFTLLLCPYNPGDLNWDNIVDILDVPHIVYYLFRDWEAPCPIKAADVNCDQEVTIADAVYLINYLFKSGDPPCDLRYPQCKTFQTGALADIIPPDQDCIEYQYDGEGTLVLDHINAGFNCCPSNLTADISIEQSLITITEYEHFDNTGPCYCLCLFDVDYQINNLPPGEYTIKVNEVYLEEGDELLEFTVNLPPSPYSGSFCVFRSHYPWMP